MALSRELRTAIGKRAGLSSAVKFQPPETYLGQLLYPFRRKGQAMPYG